MGTLILIFFIRNLDTRVYFSKRKLQELGQRLHQVVRKTKRTRTTNESNAHSDQPEENGTKSKRNKRKSRSLCLLMPIVVE